MMRIISCLIFVASLLGCTSDKNTKAIPEIDSFIQDSSTTKYDSLGYPDYYTHPEINNIEELRTILNQATSVVAYNFNGHNGNAANVECEYLYNIKTGDRCGSANVQRILDQKQINKLIAITCDTSTYTGQWSGLAGVCFIPHLGFGFFHRDSLIAQVNVCFLCGGIRTKPLYKSDGLTKKGGVKYADLAKELGLEVVDGSTKLSY